MKTTNRGSRKIGLGLLLVYGLIIPLLLINDTGAEKFIRNGAWRYSVDFYRNEQVRLRINNESTYSNLAVFARDEWQGTSAVNVFFFESQET